MLSFPLQPLISVPATCHVRSYKGGNLFSEASRSCPPLALALSRAKAKHKGFRSVNLITSGGFPGLPTCLVQFYSFAPYDILLLSVCSTVSARRFTPLPPHSPLIASCILSFLAPYPRFSTSLSSPFYLPCCSFALFFFSLSFASPFTQVCAVILPSRQSPPFLGRYSLSN